MNTLHVHEMMERDEIEAYFDEVRDRIMLEHERKAFISGFTRFGLEQIRSDNPPDSFIVTLSDRDDDAKPETWQVKVSNSRTSELILHYITRRDIFTDREVYQIRITDCPCASPGDDGDTPDISLTGCEMCCPFPFDIPDYKQVIESEAIARYAMRWMGSVNDYDHWIEHGEL